MADDVPREWVMAALAESMKAVHARRIMSEEDMATVIIAAVAPLIANAERNRILEGVRYEGSMRSCAEDTVVIKYIATLIEADFSYDKADELAAIRARGEGT